MADIEGICVFSKSPRAKTGSKQGAVPMTVSKTRLRRRLVGSACSKTRHTTEIGKASIHMTLGRGKTNAQGDNK